MKGLTVPRSVKSNKNKDKILDAARKIIAENGFEYLTVRNVCTVADVSTGTFYHYYANKEALLSEFLRISYQANEDKEAEEKKPLDFTDEIVDTYTEHAHNLQESGLEFVASYYTNKNSALDTFHHKTARIELTDRLFTQAQQDGLVSSFEPPETMSLDVCFIVKGSVFSWCLAEGDFDLAERVRKLIVLYIRSVASEAYRAKLDATYDLGIASEQEQLKAM